MHDDIVDVGTLFFMYHINACYRRRVRINSNENGNLNKILRKVMPADEESMYPTNHTPRLGIKIYSTECC